MKDAKGSYELRGKTLGIRLYGNIGSQVKCGRESLGMKASSMMWRTKLPLGNAEDARTCEGTAASRCGDQHVPETAQTKNLINKNNWSDFQERGRYWPTMPGEAVDLEALPVFWWTDRRGSSGCISGNRKNGAKHRAGPAECNTPPAIGRKTQQNERRRCKAKLFNYPEKGITFGSHTVPALHGRHGKGHRILHEPEHAGVLSQINTTLSENKINIPQNHEDEWGNRLRGAGCGPEYLGHAIKPAEKRCLGKIKVPDAVLRYSLCHKYLPQRFAEFFCNRVTQSENRR